MTRRVPQGYHVPGSPWPTYREALKAAKAQGGWAHATGATAIAGACSVLAIRACVNPGPLYEGAMRAGMSNLDIAKADNWTLLDLALTGGVAPE